MTMSKTLEVLAAVVFLAGVACYALAAIAINRTGRAFTQLFDLED